MGDVDAGVIGAFERYFNERAEAGVLLAKAVSRIEFDEGVVRVTFDPAKAGVSRDLLLGVNPFENLAALPGTVVAFKNDDGELLRLFVTRIETFLADGTDLGAMEAAEIFKRGTGRDLY